MAIQTIIESLNTAALKTDIPVMDVGDNVNVHCRIVEGSKERIQIFSGVLISRHGRGVNEMIVVRRVVEEQGVERIFPINSPRIAMFEVTRRGRTRRAKLYYLRDRKGKSRRLGDRSRGMKHVEGVATKSTNPIEIKAVDKGDKKKK